MGEKHGVKETKEAALALIILGKLVADISKDGIEANDLTKLIAAAQDPEFQKVVKAGVDGAEKIDDEIKDLSLAEGLELGAELLPAILEVLKKKDA